MVEQQLLDYIRTSQQSGMSLDTIKQDLLSAGWIQDQIDKAFRVVNIPKPSVPVPSSPLINPWVATPAKKEVSRPNPTSPYSALLGVTLFVSLLILVDNAIGDITNLFLPGQISTYGTITIIPTESISTVLIVRGILVLSFWGLTSLLYFSFRDHSEKFRILLTPYYITAGWVLIELLFYVGGYLLSTSSTFGVYVVLGMIIAVLTGGTWGVQKYIHNKTIQ